MQFEKEVQPPPLYLIQIIRIQIMKCREHLPYLSLKYLIFMEMQVPGGQPGKLNKPQTTKTQRRKFKNRSFYNNGCHVVIHRLR